MIRSLKLLAAALTPAFCLAQDAVIIPYKSFQLPAKKDVTSLAFAMDRNLLAAADDKGNLFWLNLEDDAQINSVKLKKSSVFVAFLRQDEQIVGVDKSGTISTFAVATGEMSRTFHSKASPTAIALDAGRRFLAVASSKKRIEIFDLTAGMQAGEIDARKKIDKLLFLGFNRLGDQLIAITERGKVLAWNPVTQRLMRESTLASNEMHGSRSSIHSACTNRSSNVFVVGLQEVVLPKGGLRKGLARPTDLIRRNMVIAYDWNSGMEIKRIKFPPGTVKNMTLGPGNDHVAVTNNHDDSITLIDLRKGELGSSVSMPKHPEVLAVSDDDRWLAAGSADGFISVWQLQMRTRSAELEASSLPSLSGRIRKSQPDLGPALPADVPVTAAILNFAARGISENIGNIGLDVLTTSLANFSHISLVERERIQAIMDELKLQTSGLTEKDGAQIGRLLNADRVILCSVSVLGGTYLFSARVVNVETARVVAGRQVICEECREQDIFDAINMLAATIAQ